MDDEDLLSHILTEEGIRNFSQDLRQLSAAELRALFAFASSGKTNTTRVIKNLIWQAYTAIRDGRRPPIAGNLRSFWYTDIKPVLSRLGVPVEGRRATELVYDAFVELVTHHHLFHYRDLGFLDEGAQTRAVGQTNGTVILFAEKDGRFRPKPNTRVTSRKLICPVSQTARTRRAAGLSCGGSGVCTKVEASPGRCALCHSRIQPPAAAQCRDASACPTGSAHRD